MIAKVARYLSTERVGGRGAWRDDIIGFICGLLLLNIFYISPLWNLNAKVERGVGLLEYT